MLQVWSLAGLVPLSQMPPRDVSITAGRSRSNPVLGFTAGSEVSYGQALGVVFGVLRLRILG